MEKCKNILQHPHARFIDTCLNAANMLQPALVKHKNRQHENAAYFEPFYLKEYIAKKSVVKGLFANHSIH
jgi:tRNA threonylcarbamoyladenosine biosynthesis protein TsaB